MTEEQLVAGREKEISCETRYLEGIKEFFEPLVKSVLVSHKTTKRAELLNTEEYLRMLTKTVW